MSNVNSLAIAFKSINSSNATSRRPRVAPKQILQTQTQTVIAYLRNKSSVIAKK